MSWFSRDSKVNESTKLTIKWVELKSMEQAKSYIEKNEIPTVIFKHSTQCSISVMALNRLEREWKLDSSVALPVYLDLLAHRAISNYLAETLEIQHQSPQVLVVHNGKCIFTSSHNAISASSIEAIITTLSA